MYTISTNVKTKKNEEENLTVLRIVIQGFQEDTQKCQERQQKSHQQK